MQRIKRVINILQYLVMRALFPTVQPDRDQGKQGERLARNAEIPSENCEFVGKSSEKLHIDICKAQKLARIAPPFSLTEKIEYKNHPYSLSIVINHSRRPENVSQNDSGGPGQDFSPQLPFGLFIQPDQPQRD